jgi:CBS domain-containing protein
MGREIRRVEDVMERRVEALAPEAALHDAVDLLLKRRYAAAPVTDAHGQLLGMFSEHDCIRLLAEAVYEGWPAGTVSAHMTRTIEHVAPEDDLLAVARRFAESHHRVLPVVRAGRVVGLVGRAEIMRALDHMLDAEGPKTTYELISEHRR